MVDDEYAIPHSVQNQVASCMHVNSHMAAPSDRQQFVVGSLCITDSKSAARNAGKVAIINMTLFYLEPHLSYQAYSRWARDRSL